MWFLTAGPVVCIPMILTEFPQGKNCGSFFKKHNFIKQVQLFDIYCRFFSCLHLAVGRHHRRRTSWCPHGLQLSRVKVFLADHVHTRSWINYKLSFLRLFCWRSQEYPFLRGKVECSLVCFFELVNVFGNIPSLASGTSLLSFRLLWTCPQISLRRDFADEELWHFISQLDVAWTQWIVLFELVSRLSPSGVSETFYFEKPVHLNLVIHKPIVIHFSQ